jgi:hypothetical protein
LICRRLMGAVALSLGSADVFAYYCFGTVMAIAK